MKAKIIFLLSIISFSLFSIVQNDNKLMLTGGTSKVWNLTNCLINGYEINTDQDCSLENIKYRFHYDDQLIISTTCNQDSLWQDKTVSFMMDDTSFTFMDNVYEIVELTDVYLRVKKEAEIALEDTLGLVVFDDKMKRVSQELIFEIK